MYTTLNAIRKYRPCKPSWTKLLNGLGKTAADDEPIPITKIIDILGIEDAIWCLRAVDAKHIPWIKRYALWCATQLRHLMADRRSAHVLDVAIRYLDGQATEAEMRAATGDAYRTAVAREICAPSDTPTRQATEAEMRDATCAVRAAHAALGARTALSALSAISAISAADAASYAAAVDRAPADGAWLAYAAARSAQETELRRICALTE